MCRNLPFRMLSLCQSIFDMLVALEPSDFTAIVVKKT